MKTAKSVAEIILLVILGWLCLRGPLGGAILGFFWGGKLKLGILPLLAMFAVIYLFVVGIRPIIFRNYIFLVCAFALLSISIVGHIHDFTAYGESSPGPWEWVNNIPFFVSVPFIALVTWRVKPWCHPNGA